LKVRGTFRKVEKETFYLRDFGLHKRLVAAKNPNDRTRLWAQIEATDREIDRLVYDLYDLTDDEIAIVERKTDVTS
jgi:type II restriction/modification system DNA methylase subunit YeeA